MNAKDDSERVYSANALWMLLFDAENQSRFKEIDAAFESLLAHEVCDLILNTEWLGCHQLDSLVQKNFINNLFLIVPCFDDMFYKAPF